VLACAPALVSVVAQQSSSAAEQQIRQQIARIDAQINTAEQGTNMQLYAKDAVLWNNAYKKPFTRDAPREDVWP